jgi:hypothetical protein
MRIGNELDSDQWSVREIFDGELAQKLDAVYDLIDRQFSDDFVVRLLSIRSYQLNALWILNPHTGEQNVVVVTTSDASNAIQTGIVYSSREFLRILRTMSIVQGIEGVREQPNFNPFLSSNSHGGWTIEIAIHFHLRYAAKN